MELRIIPRCQTPKVRRPSPQNQHQQRTKKSRVDFTIQPQFPARLIRFALRINLLAGVLSFLSRPLQSSQIICEKTPNEQCHTDDHGAGRQDNIDDDDVIVGIVIVVLDDSCENADDDVHAVVDHDFDRVCYAKCILIPDGSSHTIDDGCRAQRRSDRVDSKCGCSARDCGPECGETHGAEAGEAADEEDGQAVAVPVDEGSQEGHEKETEISRRCSVPTGFGAVDIESLLGQFGGILRKDHSHGCLEGGEADEAPKGHGKVHSFFDFKFLRVFPKFLSRGRVFDAIAVVLVAVFAEIVESSRGEIGEDVHEDGSPIDPAEVAGALGDGVRGGGSDELSYFANCKFETEGGSEAVRGSEPRAEDPVLGHLCCDVSKGLHHDAANHQLVAADSSCCCDDDRSQAVDNVPPHHDARTTKAIGQQTSEQHQHCDHEILRCFPDAVALAVSTVWDVLYGGFQVERVRTARSIEYCRYVIPNHA